jgi:hypothetical protein
VSRSGGIFEALVVGAGYCSAAQRYGAWIRPSAALSVHIDATKRGERPLIGLAGGACQFTVRQSRPTASRSLRR